MVFRDYPMFRHRSATPAGVTGNGEVRSPGDNVTTILKLLGLDHRELTYLFQGRDQRLTDVGGDREFAARLLG